MNMKSESESRTPSSGEGRMEPRGRESVIVEGQRRSIQGRIVHCVGHSEEFVLSQKGDC
jgi:hypothetical protein